MRFFALLAVGILTAAGLAVSGSAQPAPRIWKVAIGGETPDHAIQAQNYFPRMITIDAA